MKKRIISAAVIIAMLSMFSQYAAAELRIVGGQYTPIETEAERTTGLDAIYIIYGTDDTRIEYRADNAQATVEWSVFSNMGGGFAQPLTDISKNGATTTLDKILPDSGYIIKENDKTTCFWIVDYSRNRLDITDLSAAEPECDATLLHVVGKTEPIHYYTINGQQRTLPRELSLYYNTLEWDEDAKQWMQHNIERQTEISNGIIRITPPVYCSTDFELTGDRFLQEWGIPVRITSDNVSAYSVDCRTTATQDNRETVGNEAREIPETDEEEQPDNEPETPASNIIHTQTEGLGGSAPAQITFNAYVTDATLHTEWQMTDDPNFDKIDYRFNQQDLTYTFTEEGTYYLRFIGSNADGSCDTYGDQYVVNIGASELLCPNAFSPNGDGVNDIWKIAYCSLLEFRCWIFDRYGTELYYYDDPQGGWDGTYKGKTVKSGVYYYVIQAVGSDGKKYKKSGDINIINYRNNNRGNQNTTLE